MKFWFYDVSYGYGCGFGLVQHLHPLEFHLSYYQSYYCLSFSSSMLATVQYIGHHRFAGIILTQASARSNSVHSD